MRILFIKFVVLLRFRLHIVWLGFFSKQNITTRNLVFFLSQRNEHDLCDTYRFSDFFVWFLMNFPLQFRNHKVNRIIKGYDRTLSYTLVMRVVIGGCTRGNMFIFHSLSPPSTINFEVKGKRGLTSKLAFFFFFLQRKIFRLDSWDKKKKN